MAQLHLDDIKGMRVHKAIWVFAAEQGNKYAKTYADEWKQLSGENLGKRDSRWLLGRGGTRLRKFMEAATVCAKTTINGSYT